MNFIAYPSEAPPRITISTMQSSGEIAIRIDIAHLSLEAAFFLSIDLTPESATELATQLTLHLATHAPKSGGNQ